MYMHSKLLVLYLLEAVMTQTHETHLKQTRLSIALNIKK